jgi:hypothetical protein
VLYLDISQTKIFPAEASFKVTPPMFTVLNKEALDIKANRLNL